MRQFKKKLYQLTTNIIDVPQDVVADIPRLTLIGNIHLYIENHKGILHFANELLKLKIPSGTLEVYGRELVIRGISSEEILIEGVIQDMKYIQDGKG